MSPSASDRLAAAQQRLAPTTEPAPAQYVRTDPVRSTVDLAPVRHASLSTWCDEASVALGVPPGRRGVTRDMALNAMVAVLLTDETTSRRVQAQLDDMLRGKRKRRPA